MCIRVETISVNYQRLERLVVLAAGCEELQPQVLRLTLLK